jgi:hypothetical protein
MGVVLQVRTSTRETPLSLSIQHEGRASRGDRSPVNESSDEGQA